MRCNNRMKGQRHGLLRIENKEVTITDKIVGVVEKVDRNTPDFEDI